MSAVFFAQIKDLTARVIALETAIAELKAVSEAPEVFPETPENPAETVENFNGIPKRRGRPRKAEQ